MPRIKPCFPIVCVTCSLHYDSITIIAPWCDTTIVMVSLNLGLKFSLGPNRRHEVKFGLKFRLKPNFSPRLSA